MAWKKSPPELIARFDRAFPATPGAERRLMFGYPAGFINGYLFAGVFEDRVMVRLAGEAVAALKGAAPFEPMPGRKMTGYSVLPATVAKSLTALRRWLARAALAAAALPPKTPKPAPGRAKSATKVGSKASRAR